MAFHLSTSSSSFAFWTWARMVSRPVHAIGASVCETVLRGEEGVVVPVSPHPTGDTAVVSSRAGDASLLVDCRLPERSMGVEIATGRAGGGGGTHDASHGGDAKDGWTVRGVAVRRVAGDGSAVSSLLPVLLRTSGAETGAEALLLLWLLRVGCGTLSFVVCDVLWWGMGTASPSAMVPAVVEGVVVSVPVEVVVVE